MKNCLAGLFICLLLNSCSQTIYIVRHGEKEMANSGGKMMSNDPPLSDAGRQRAAALKETLKDKKIGYIFSTNTIRTRSTAEPLREWLNLTTETYQPIPEPAFFARLLSLKKNVLLVGHGNTVDDLVNKLCGSIKIPGDLADTAYDNLFVVRKKGKRMTFENKKYGSPSP